MSADQVAPTASSIAELSETEIADAIAPYFTEGYSAYDAAQAIISLARHRALSHPEPVAQEAVARCCSAVSPCSWQRHHGMDSVCPTCIAAHPSPSPEQGEDDLVQRLRTPTDGFHNQLVWLKTNKALRDEAATAISALRARVAELEARATPQAGMSAETLQARVQPWMMACFGPEISADKLERGDRLAEEVFELLQSGDYPRERLRALEGYVWAREKGEPFQEVGGVQITLAAYCLAHSLDMHEAGEAELARIWTKVDKIRAKQAAKPVGSALPIARATPQEAEPVADADLLDWCEQQGARLGAVDGYGYHSGEEAAYRHVAIEIKRRLARATPPDSDAVRAALLGLVDAVSNMRVPQTTEDAAMQVMFTLGPALTAAKTALSGKGGSSNGQ